MITIPLWQYEISRFQERDTKSDRFLAKQGNYCIESSNIGPFLLAKNWLNSGSLIFIWPLFYIGPYCVDLCLMHVRHTQKGQLTITSALNITPPKNKLLCTKIGGTYLIIYLLPLNTTRIYNSRITIFGLYFIYNVQNCFNKIDN